MMVKVTVANTQSFRANGRGQVTLASLSLHWTLALAWLLETVLNHKCPYLSLTPILFR
jgi:hypothetical protein